MFSSFASGKPQLIGFVTSGRTFFKVFVMDSVTEKVVTKFEYQSENAKDFIDQFLTENGSVFKAFIIDIFTLVFPTTSTYKISYEFCEALKKKLDQLSIPSYFISEENNIRSVMLISANINVGFGDSVIIILTHEVSLPSPLFPHQQSINNFGKTLKGQTLLVAELQYSPSGYRLINRKCIPFDSKMKPAILREKICGTSTPSKIIINTIKAKKIPFHKIFNKSKNLIFLQIDDFRGVAVNQFMAETCKWILDKSCAKFHVLPTAVKSVYVFGDYGSKNNVLDILQIEQHDPLPVTKSAFVTRSIPEIGVLFADVLTGYGYTMNLPNRCHAVEIMVKMNEESFEDIKLAFYCIKNFDQVPSKMDSLLKSKIPFVVFYDNSSFVGVCKNGKYEFLEEWNGMYGKDCFISFDEKKPKFGEAAQKMLKTKNTFVVFDLLQIMSMPSDDIKISKTWGFTFTENAENPVLLEFDNFDGTKKAASPSFLMALYLRQHLNAIKDETGEKPTEIAFCVINEKSNDDEKFNENEMKRIKDGLHESCKLLKKEASFIDDELFDVFSLCNVSI